MRITAFNSSPRKERGNTHVMVSAFLEGAREAGAKTNKIIICNRDIYPCQGCGDCYKTGECTVDDAMDTIYRQTISANGIITCTPVTEDDPRKGITIQGRSTQGVRLMRLEEGDSAVAIAAFE